MTVETPRGADGRPSPTRSKPDLAAVVLAAGQGTRMRSSIPKVLHQIARRPMVGHVIAAVTPLAPSEICVVIGPEMEPVARAVAPHPTALQAERRGTADAVKAARAALEAITGPGATGDVLILYGDTPLLTASTLEQLVAARRTPGQDGRTPTVAVLGFRPQDTAEYGRLVQDADGSLDAIVEHKDATPDQRAIGLCNSGVLCVAAHRLFPLLDRVGDNNAKREFYLTDIVGLARADGERCVVVEAPEAELLGVNDRIQLAVAEAEMQRRLRRAAQIEGATLVQPETVHFSSDTRVGRDVVIGPHVVFGPEVVIGNHVEIRAFCHIDGAVIADGAVIGPFARLRPGANIGEGAHIGNFVEIKKAIIEAGAKANHLSYIGDARVGEGANVGAGTITCNYDGFFKHHTDIGAGAFIGSNSALVAPVKIGAGAIIGAGSVVTQDVADDALAVARGRQTELPGWAQRFRHEKAADPGKTRR